MTIAQGGGEGGGGKEGGDKICLMKRVDKIGVLCLGETKFLFLSFLLFLSCLTTFV